MFICSSVNRRRFFWRSFLKAVKQMTSRKLRGPREKFWQERYYDSNVRREKARSEVIRYIHCNPVKRGLAARPEDWKWSSFRHYQTGMRGTVEIESEWTARQRGWQLPERLRYRGPSSPVPKSEEPGAPSS
jgi:putative transposase